MAPLKSDHGAGDDRSRPEAENGLGAGGRAQAGGPRVAARGSTPPVCAHSPRAPGPDGGGGQPRAASRRVIPGILAELLPGR